MMEEIEKYINNQLSTEQRKAFEQKIQEDPELAKELSFYLTAQKAVKEVRLQEKHAEFIAQASRGNSGFIKRFYLPIAASLALVVGSYFFYTYNKTNSPNMGIDQLPTIMAAESNDFQKAIGFYNNKQYEQAIVLFQKNTDQAPEATEYLGLCYLQTKQYAKAEQLFTQIASNTELLENKGYYYLALLALKQNQKDKAKILLQQVITQDLGGLQQAKEILATF
jgi:TolA-binding protein